MSASAIAVFMTACLFTGWGLASPKLNVPIAALTLAVLFVGIQIGARP